LIDYTENIFKNEKTGDLCRIVEDVFIDMNDELAEAVIIVGADGVKIAIPKDKFYHEYVEFYSGVKVYPE